MFHHRVLPPPTALSTASGYAKRDTLLEHSIMESRRRSSSSPSAGKSPPTTTTTMTTLSRTSSRNEERPPSCLTSRKRRASEALSLEDDDDENDDDETAASPPERRVPSISTLTLHTRPVESPSQVCLCQPDPKVPRPRNAFILYRQHHQAAVVAGNPGLANPEISKIIGNHWKSSPSDVKAHWKQLAEEEKLRHQRQYPDYRYQPRRAGRTANLTQNGAEGQQRCPRCGGKSMTNPSISPSQFLMPGTPTMPGTPMTPYHTSIAASGPPGGRTVHYAGGPPMHAPVFSPRIPSTMYGRGPPPPPPPLRSEGPMSPDAKRRRYENGAYLPVRAVDTQLARGAYAYRRDSLPPRPDHMPRGNFAAGAPPRPGHAGGDGGSPHDRSLLTLAPLRTREAPPAPQAAGSVEAAIMSIRQTTKIKILSKIAPPLAAPGPASPPRAVRGAVVAVEGTDAVAARAVIDHLTEALERTGEYRVRVWEGPRLEEAGAAPPSLSDLLALMARWHAISREVVAYTTTAAAADEPRSPVSPKTNPSSSSSPPVPVAIVPRYQLTGSDLAAAAIPIVDAYAPVDHWQWVATLWRGTVGPDVTVALVPSAPDVVGPLSSSSPSPPSLPSSARPGVDVRLEDAGALLVGYERRGRPGDAVLRRVGFEVGEWLRGMEERRRGERGRETETERERGMVDGR